MVPAEGAHDLFCTLASQRPEPWWIWPQRLVNGGTDSLAVKQALKSETVVESREILTKGGGEGGGMKSLLAASTTGIHQRLSRQLPWVGNELVLSVCVLKQARGTLILPNQGPRWHIPSVIFLLLFCSDIKTEQGKTCLVSFAVECT